LKDEETAARAYMEFIRTQELRQVENSLKDLLKIELLFFRLKILPNFLMLLNSWRIIM
jgi:hypothetical protein